MKYFNKEDKENIIKHLKNNELFIIKTDTVYGIMALANKENELKINKIKNSDLNKKISIIFPDKDNLLPLIKDLTKEKKSLIEDKLPGAYTFIVKLNNFSNFDREDFGVRVTCYDFLQNIIKEVGPLLATSCNITGDPVCMTKEDIIKVFNDKDINLVFDCDAVNKPSTIIDITSDIKIIRN